MSRSKQQGTAAETRIVQLHLNHGIQARRLAEGGRADEGDVEVLAATGRVVGEVKDRERLSLHDTLAQAERKAGTHRVAVFWTRRSATTPAAVRRSATTPAAVRRSRTQRLVAVPEPFWLELIGQPPPDMTRGGELPVEFAGNV